MSCLDILSSGFSCFERKHLHFKRQKWLVTDRTSKPGLFSIRLQNRFRWNGSNKPDATKRRFLIWFFLQTPVFSRFFPEPQFFFCLFFSWGPSRRRRRNLSWIGFQPLCLSQLDALAIEKKCHAAYKIPIFHVDVLLPRIQFKSEYSNPTHIVLDPNAKDYTDIPMNNRGNLSESCRTECDTLSTCAPCLSHWWHD